MTDTTSSYDDIPRRYATLALQGWWSSNLPRSSWVWGQFHDAADVCAGNACKELLDGELGLARMWASAYQLLMDRVDRGHREAERHRERVKAAVA